MAQRIIKNYTDSDFVLTDLGNQIIPAHGALDIGGNESRLVELASSDSVLEVLAQGLDNFQLNDGIKDLGFSEGIDLIRRIQRLTTTDKFGKWIVRSDSRKSNYDTVFTGRGDKESPKEYHAGTWFRWDFSASSADERWIQAGEGYKTQRIIWKFFDGVLLKEGAIYQFNMPKGSYVNLYIKIPAGTYFYKKVLNSSNEVEKVLTQVDEETIIHRWVIDYPVEGSAPMGDELNTESATEESAPDYATWVADITVPEVEGWQEAHGHFTLEIYRYNTIYWGE